MRIPNIVVSVWFIIVGGWIIFFDGRGWCICCREMILTGMGVICLVMGLIGLVGGMKAGNTNVR
jgi:hypothetical protein